MACFWLFVSHLLLLLLPRYHGTSFGHALEYGPALPEGGLPAVTQDVGLDRKLAKRHVAMRNPQDAPTTTEDPTSTSTDSSQADQNTTTTEPGNGDTTTDGEQSTTTSEEMPSTSDAQPVDDGNTSETSYDEPVQGYQPSIGPIEDDAAYPDYSEQVMNSTVTGQYQYQILINADCNGMDIPPEDYMDYDTSSMLKCIGACDAYNNNHGSAAVCQAVAYYGDSECYLLTDMYRDADSYVYYSPGGITGLLLRTPSYPTPTETNPTDDMDDNNDDGNYDTTTTTTSTISVSQSGYSTQTIMPTDAYGKTTVNIYISACPTTTY